MDLSRPNTPGRLQQTDDGLTGEGFTRTGLAHNAKNLSGQDIEGYIIHGHQDATAGIKFYSKMLNL